MRFSKIPAMLLAVLAVASYSARATDSIVQLDTSVGTMTFELYDDAKPITVANFLRYIQDGKYAGSFAHRLIQNFVLQGGGFYVDSSNSVNSVVSYGTITNEAGPFPTYSNVQGTLAMAKLGGDPNSASSQWFLNLADNSTNLDAQNGGFTVFGKLLTGASVMQTILAFTSYTGTDGSDLIADMSGGNTSSPFTDVPVTKVQGGNVSTTDLFYTTWSIVSAGSAAPTPTPTATATPLATISNPPVLSISGSKSITTAAAALTLKGAAAGQLSSITYRLGTKGAWKKVSASGPKWKITVRPVPMGRNQVTIIGHGSGGDSSPAKVTILRR
jgi:cyclophilin family peptidyl-prolyl cis-trans isomerase